MRGVELKRAPGHDVDINSKHSYCINIRSINDF